MWKGIELNLVNNLKGWWSLILINENNNQHRKEEGEEKLEKGEEVEGETQKLFAFACRNVIYGWKSELPKRTLAITMTCTAWKIRCS